jgi:hypothetical protein
MKAQVQAILLGLASVLSGCGGGGSAAPPLAGDPCSETAKKQFVLDTARDRYLFLDLLPASVEISQYSVTSRPLRRNNSCWRPAHRSASACH